MTNFHFQLLKMATSCVCVWVRFPCNNIVEFPSRNIEDIEDSAAVNGVVMNAWQCTHHRSIDCW